MFRIQFWEVFQVAGPQVHHIADKDGFTNSKNSVFTISWNQGNHNVGHSRIQTDHNLGH